MKFFKNKKIKIFKTRTLGLLLVLAIGFVFSSKLCQAGAAEIAGNAVLIAFNAILNLIMVVVTYVFAGASWLLELMLSPDVYEKVFFSPVAIKAIKETWTVVRDFFNMFFMLIIILVAIGTILRVSRFSDKKIILNVVLAALLVNFSLPITLVIIDVSQLAMTFFMEGVSQEGFKFTNQIADGITFGKIWEGKFTDNIGFFVNLIFAIIFMLIMAIMIAILAFSLLIRMVAYWVLLILSPLAMFGISLKGTGLGGEKMTSGWFEKMSYYSFFGPILVFFLWIALQLTNTITETTLGSDYFKNAFDAENYASSLGTLGKVSIGALQIMLPFFVAIYLLFYGYDLSKKASTGAVSGVMGWGSKKINQWGKTWGKRAAIGAGLGTGVGALGYWGYKHAKSDLKARSNWLSEKPGARFLTKKGREDMAKERDQKYESRIVDEKSRKDVKRDFDIRKNREKANKITKDWKEVGAPSEDNLKTLLVHGSEPEKIAAAQELSKKGRLGAQEKVKDKNGNITEVNLYAEAIKAAGQDKGLIDEINGEAKKKNKYAMMKYNVDGNTDKFKEDAAKYALLQEKARIRRENKGKQEDEIEAILKQEIGDNEEDWKKKYKASKTKNEMEQDYYFSNFEGMKLRDYADQEIEMHKNKHFKEFINQKKESPNYQKAINKAVTDGVFNAEQLAIWENNGFLENSSEKQSSQGTRETKIVDKKGRPYRL